MFRSFFAAVLGAALAHGVTAASAQTIKIAVIDPLSGPSANLGLNILHTMHLAAERDSKSNPAGVKFEFVPLDNKGSVAETLNVLKSAIDQGIRYVSQGVSGSGAGNALIEAINKHNERNPGKEIVYLNHSAMDPALTNERCSFWHFRFDADTSMKTEALGQAIKDDKSIDSVYLLNPNYVHGHQVTRFTKEVLERKAPNVKIVGEDLVPLLQVKDFSPYVAKIKASGAKAVITGNVSSDLNLLFRAAKDAGLDVKFFTYYAGQAGGPTILGNYGLGKVKSVYPTYTNMGGEYGVFRKAYAEKFPSETFVNSPSIQSLRMLAAAMDKAKSTDPVKVAKAMEGLSLKSLGNEVTMRAADHQLQMPLYVFSWGKVDATHNPNDVEETGNTWVLDKKIEAFVASTPTSCQMKRPG